MLEFDLETSEIDLEVLKCSCDKVVFSTNIISQVINETHNSATFFHKKTLAIKCRISSKVNDSMMI